MCLFASDEEMTCVLGLIEISLISFVIVIHTLWESFRESETRRNVVRD